MKQRLVVSCINSFSSIFSTWIDFRMKELVHLIPSYVKEFNTLYNQIKNLKLPPNAKIFTADASAMYTNIDTNTVITSLTKIFRQYKDQISPGFPKEFFLSALQHIIFTFGNTFWLQLCGTALGTPAAPLYSTITFGYHENPSKLSQKSTLLQALH